MMKKLLLYSVLVVLLTIAAAGCAAEDDLAFPTLTVTIPPTNTLAPSETATLPPPTATHTLTSTPYLRVCTKLDEVDQIEAEEVLIIETADDDVPVITSPDGTQIKTISNKYYLSGVVSSPDRTKYAYIQNSPRALVIASVEGSSLRSYRIPEDWRSPLSWVSDNMIFVIKDLDEDSRLELHALIIFDPDTGSYEEMSPDFPDILPWVDSQYWHWNLIFLPDPTLNYTIYELDGAGISLWDSDSQTEIMRLYKNHRTASAPVWSWDGGWFIASAPVTFEEDGVRYTNVESELPYVTGAYDLFLVTTQGKIRRLTYLSTQYDSLQKSMSLSPDGTKLAFWVDTDIRDGDFNWQLAVLDIPAGGLHTYCISAGDLQNPLVPRWSPEGDGLMVTIYDPTIYMSSEIFLINLLTNEIFTYPENAFGEGWLTLEE